MVQFGGVPVDAEVEVNDAVVIRRFIPLIANRRTIGALLLVREVTELRQHERALMVKDATIREIHHRVKNNLQTVAALLRLQARRLKSDEARAALGESVRRITSIAWTPMDPVEPRTTMSPGGVMSLLSRMTGPDSALHQAPSGQTVENAGIAAPAT